MTIEDAVLNHLLDVVAHMENREFEVNDIQYDGFQRTWEYLEPNERKSIGKKFAKKVENHEVDNIEYVSTSNDNHNHYKKI